MGEIDKVRISKYQLGALIIAFIFGMVINPAAQAKQDAWLVMLLAWFIGFGIAGFFVLIAQMYPDKTLIQMLKSTFGNILGSFIGLLYCWYFIHLAAIVIRNHSEFIHIHIYPETPKYFIIGILIFLIAYIVRNGLEVMGRVAELFVPVIPLLVIFMTLLLLGEFNFTNYKPFLAQGIGPVLQGVKTLIGFPYGELVIFLMIFPALNDKKDLLKTTWISIFIIGFVLVVLTVREIMVLGPDMFYRHIFPASLTAKMIPGVKLDPIIDLNMLIGGNTKVAICIYAAVRGIKEIFNLKSYRLLVLPIIAFTFVLSLWLYDTILETVDWSAQYYFIYAFPFEFIFPSIILVVSLWKKKIKKKSKKGDR